MYVSERLDVFRFQPVRDVDGGGTLQCLQCTVCQSAELGYFLIYISNQRFQTESILGAKEATGTDDFTIELM